MPMPQKTVVITGAAGNLGGKVRRHFEGLGWALRLIDVTDGGDRKILAADLPEWAERWVAEFADADAVIHFTADPSPAASWASIEWSNIDLMLNVYEAAVRKQAQRHCFSGPTR